MTLPTFCLLYKLQMWFNSQNFIQINRKIYFNSENVNFLLRFLIGQLKTARLIDREKRSRYVLEAHVQDKGKPEWECTSTVEVLLSDVNDNAPEFAKDLYSVNIPEDAEVGTLITKVHASDRDIGKKMTHFKLHNFPS